MNKNLFLLCSIFLVISCTEKVKTLDFESSVVFDDEDFEETIMLESQELKGISDSLRLNAKIFVIKDYLILNEIKSDRFLHILNLPDEKYLGNYGSVGAGPGEVLVPWELSKSESGLFRVMDPQQNKIVEFVMDSLLNHNIHNKEYSLPSSSFSRNACVDDGNIYYLDGNNLGHRLFEIGLENEKIKGYGFLPSKEDGIKDFQHVLQVCAATLSNENERFAIGHRYLPLIQVFNRENKKWNSILGPENYIPKFENHMRKIQYTEVKIIDGIIYALYNGNKNTNEHSKIIYVLDFHGIPIKKMILDKGIVSFDIYKGEFLYGINMETKSKVLKFKI